MRGAETGFTFLEVVLVITILSILAVFAMGSAGDIVSKAYESSENATISAVQQGITIQNAAESITP